MPDRELTSLSSAYVLVAKLLFFFKLVFSVNKLLDRSWCDGRALTACWFVEEPVSLAIIREMADTAVCHTQSLLVFGTASHSPFISNTLAQDLGV
jgi:hypothetical protein